MARDRVAPHAEELLEQLREAARPPRGVRLSSDDGHVYTGVLLVDRNQVVVMLAVRDARSSERERPTAPTYGGSGRGFGSMSDSRDQYGSARSLFDHERPRYDRTEVDDDDDPAERWRR